MNRRQFIKTTSSALPLATFSNPLAFAQSRGSERPSLFFSPSEIPAIRRNTKTDLLGPLYKQWKDSPIEALKSKLDAFDASGDVIRDFLYIMQELERSSLIQIAEPSRDRRDSIIAAIKRIIAIPRWDYFQDGPEEHIGIQRSSLATVRLLFAREAIWDDFDSELDQRLLAAVAEKGCLPCYRTIYDMENPDTVRGWRFSDRHADYFDITMDRWPMILGANNLRAAPGSALGIGALALLGQDDRAQTWLDAALASQQRVMKLFGPDGSFFEGISYTEYTLRTSFSFFEAHHRRKGQIDWLENFDLNVFVDFILTMQAGKREDGMPDIVNFSDARRSVVPSVPAWIARRTNSAVAQYAAENASEPHSFLDFLWYQPKRRSKKPPARLKNTRNHLDWIIARTGWEADDAVLAFRSGGPANHEHADRNTFLYKIHGERILNDPFGATYDWRHGGWPLRLTQGHNGVLIDGKGSHYHRGEEGTNDSLSYATILQYEDHDKHVWWTSDATAAYRIDNYHIFKVLRSVLFAKPNIIVVLDRVELRYRPQKVDIRFFPDNRDGKAEVATNGDRFTIVRPKVRLHGKVLAQNTANVRVGKLDVPADIGAYPCIETLSSPALQHSILTVMVAQPGSGSELPKIETSLDQNEWRIQTEELTASIHTLDWEPKIEIG